MEGSLTDRVSLRGRCEELRTGMCGGLGDYNHSLCATANRMNAVRPYREHPFYECMGFADRLFSDADQEMMRSLENPTESRQQAGRSRQAGSSSSCFCRAESVHASVAWRLAPGGCPAGQPPPMSCRPPYGGLRLDDACQHTTL
eukprot:COSAG01_NODE_1146_length_11522_cov_103.027916_12_plen_144_part_00